MLCPKHITPFLVSCTIFRVKIYQHHHRDSLLLFVVGASWWRRWRWLGYEDGDCDDEDVVVDDRAAAGRWLAAAAGTYDTIRVKITIYGVVDRVWWSTLLRSTLHSRRRRRRRSQYVWKSNLCEFPLHTLLWQCGVFFSTD